MGKTMEQKKILWIIIASGVFLLVVIFAARILNSPKAMQAPAVAAITTIETPRVAPVSTPQDNNVANAPLDLNGQPGQPLDPNQQMQPPQQPGPNPGQAPRDFSHVDNMTVIAGTTNVYDMNQGTTIDLNATRNQPSPNVTPTSEGGANAIAAATDYVAPKTQSVASQEKTTAEPVKKVANTIASSKPAPKVASKPAPAKVAKPAPVETKKYWVQTASFTNKQGADVARTTLNDNKIPAEIFTYKDNKDKLFYRVRVGPYTTKSEAEYWKTRICKIDTFKDSSSYITESHSVN